MSKVLPLEKRISDAVGKGRTIWISVVFVATLITLIALPFWFAIFLIPFAVVSYFAMIFIVFLIMRESVTEEDMVIDRQGQKLRDLQGRLERGEIYDHEELMGLMQDAGLAELSQVEAMSEEIFGHMGDKPMHEWVEMVDPSTKKLERFFYFGIAFFDKQGMPVLPQEKNRVYANVDGLVYYRDVQPV